MNLYDALEIPKSSTAEEIKAAYRRMAMKYHPDRNPYDEDKHRFVEVQKAYEVLRDEERRAEYDATGVWGDEKPSLEMRARQELASLFNQILSLQDIPPGVDIVKMMKDSVGAALSRQQDQLRSLNRERQKVARVRSRLSCTSKEGILLALLEQRRRDIWKAYRSAQDVRRLMAKVGSMVSEYTYEVDSVPLNEGVVVRYNYGM